MNYKMSPIVYTENNLKLGHLKNSIKSCIYLNRLLRDGMKNDFYMDKAFEFEQNKYKTNKVETKNASTLVT